MSSPSASGHRRAPAGRWRRSVVVVVATALAATGWVAAFAPQALPDSLAVRLGLIEPPLAPATPQTFRTSAYAFSELQPRPDDGRGDQPDGQSGDKTSGRIPVGWDPCRVLRVEINPDHAPGGAAHAEAMVRTTVRRIHAASGLDVRVVGTTDRRPSRLSRGPVLVAWSSPREVKRLAGDVVGLGGSAEERRSGERYVHYVTGQLALDTAAMRRLSQTEQQAILDHEFAHVVGLAHVKDKTQLMYPRSAGVTRFGTGDLTGLALLGRVPCG